MKQERLGQPQLIDNFITLKELVPKAGIGRNLIFEGLKMVPPLPSHKFGRARRFRWTEVSAWLVENGWKLTTRLARRHNDQEIRS